MKAQTLGVTENQRSQQKPGANHGKSPSGLPQKSFARIQKFRFIMFCKSYWANCPPSTPCWFIRYHPRHFLRPLALRSESPLRILASRPIFGPGGWVARPRPPFWPHFSRLRDSYRRTMLYSRPLHELSWQRRILHASHACTGRDECLPERRSAF